MIFGTVGILLLLAAGVMWKFHFNHFVIDASLWMSMTSLGITQVVLLRYIGMPSDEDVEKLSPGWAQLVHKSSSQ